VTRHHLCPQGYGRKKARKAHAQAFPVLTLHKICHRMIHALISEKPLAAHLNTIKALRAHPAMQSFLEFIEDKPRASMCACGETKKRSNEISPQDYRSSSH
jgi:hypothetical protein